jgi:TonB family protein
VIAAAIVLLVAHALIPRLTQRSAAERHLMWASAISAAAALPVLGLVLPSWSPDWVRGVADAWPDSLSALRPWSSAQGADVVVRATAVEMSWNITWWAMWCWIAGSGVALAVIARDVARLMRVAREARRSTDPRTRRICTEIADRLRLAHAPDLLASARAVMPMTWGVHRARVLLPVSAIEWPDDRLRAVLAHELAHVRRGDWIVHVCMQLVCAVFWFHPLFWTAERALGRESEQAADDEAIGVGIEPGQYAAQVIEIVRATRAALAPRAPAVAMARIAHLEHRVAALLRTNVNRHGVTRRVAIATAALTATVVVPLAAMTANVALDVDVRAGDVPHVVVLSTAHDAEPMIPAVRRAGSLDPAFSLPTIEQYTTPPLYSDEARRRGIEGIVTIAVRVDERGDVERARVVRGLGFGLDQNALVAVRQWRFRPGSRAGVPIAIDAEVDIEFSLRSEGVNELIANDMATLVGPGVTPPRVVRTSRVPLNGVRARGSVILDVVLMQDGSPKIVRILKSLSPDADESAVRHFEQWRFSPATKNGVPVKVRMNAEVRFHG